MTMAPSETVDGRGTRRDDLHISPASTVYHPQLGVLSQGFRTGYGTIYHPIVFNSKATAAQWIAEGVIAELQENSGNLDVGFRKQCWVPNEQ